MFTPKRRKRTYRSDWLETSKSDRQILGMKCEKCGSTEKVQRHHIISLNRDRRGQRAIGGGGPDNLLNIMLLCENCHTRQHRKLKRNR
jgi:5-methylcytosine-specific restriction endonuclease McrA